MTRIPSISLSVGISSVVLAARRGRFGGGWGFIGFLSLEGPAGPADGPAPGTVIGVETLIAGLDRLESLDRRKADVVKLRVIWGLEMREIAEALGVSLATVERDWSFAKAWLAREAAAAG